MKILRISWEGAVPVQNNGDIRVSIYGLIDPRSGELRYVGRTKRALAVRLSGHIQYAKQASDRHVHSWIRGLLASGMKPEVMVLEQSTADDWPEAEQFWIEYSRWMGADLTNIALGGDGSLGFRHKPEQRAKWSRERRGEAHCLYGKPRPAEVHAALKAGRERWQETTPHPMLGKKHPPETIERIKAARAANPPVVSEAGRESQRRALLERWQDPAWKERFSLRMSGENNPAYGKPMTPEKRAQLIKSGPDNPRYGTKHTDETKAKMAAAHVGKVASEEARRKMSETAMRRNSSRPVAPPKKYTFSRPKGWKPGVTKLTAEAIPQIRTLYASGEWNQRQIAERFGVSVGAIAKVISGRTWVDVQ